MEIQGGSGATNNHFSRPGLDIWLTSQSGPTDRDGGSDLYLLSSCASGRITRILLADVCSYASDFEATASELRKSMKNNINTIKQKRFVHELDEHLQSCAEHGCFATIVLSTYFSPTRNLTLCNVGHAPPLLFTVKSQKWSTLKQTSDKPSISDSSPSVVGRDEFQEFTVKLEVGDLVVSYSSALTECYDKWGHTLGCEGLLDRIRQLDPHSPHELIERFLQGIRLEHNDNLVTEDATLILCQATPSRVSWLDNLLAPFHYLTTASDKTRFRTRA
jgi:sigma-B regulation protein RsbU (phosphoserine phosphatase)